MTDIPYMQQKDIDMLNSYFKSYKPKTVLEWGAGGSTVYFPKIFPFIKEWYSVEHDSTWINKILHLVKSNVTIFYRHPKNYDLDLVIKNILSEADFVIIDGIYRKECLQHAAQHSKKNALTFLHDSGRTTYHVWFDAFPINKKLTDGRVSDGKGGFQRDGLHLFLHEQ